MIYPGRGPGHKGRQEQALAALRPPGLAAAGPCGCSRLTKMFPSSAAGVGSAWSPSLSCNWVWLLPPPSPLSLATSCFHFTAFAWACPSAWSPLPQLLPLHKLQLKSCLPSPPPTPQSPCFLVTPVFLPGEFHKQRSLVSSVLARAGAGCGRRNSGGECRSQPKY